MSMFSMPTSLWQIEPSTTSRTLSGEFVIEDVSESEPRSIWSLISFLVWSKENAFSSLSNWSKVRNCCEKACFSGKLSKSSELEKLTKVLGAFLLYIITFTFLLKGLGSKFERLKIDLTGKFLTLGVDYKNGTFSFVSKSIS